MADSVLEQGATNDDAVEVEEIHEIPTKTVTVAKTLSSPSHVQGGCRLHKFLSLLGASYDNQERLWSPNL